MCRCGRSRRRWRESLATRWHSPSPYASRCPPSTISGAPLPLPLPETTVKRAQPDMMKADTSATASPRNRLSETTITRSASPRNRKCKECLVLTSHGASECSGVQDGVIAKGHGAEALLTLSFKGLLLPGLEQNVLPECALLLANLCTTHLQPHVMSQRCFGQLALLLPGRHPPQSCWTWTSAAGGTRLIGPR